MCISDKPPPKQWKVNRMSSSDSSQSKQQFCAIISMYSVILHVCHYVNFLLCGYSTVLDTCMCMV